MKNEESVRKKSIPLAIGLNFLLPGLGYLYMGKTILGIGAFILGIAWGWAHFSLPSHLKYQLFWIPLGYYIIMMIDMLTLGNKNKKDR